MISAFVVPARPALRVLRRRGGLQLGAGAQQGHARGGALVPYPGAHRGARLALGQRFPCRHKHCTAESGAGSSRAPGPGVFSFPLLLGAAACGATVQLATSDRHQFLDVQSSGPMIALDSPHGVLNHMLFYGAALRRFVRDATTVLSIVTDYRKNAIGSDDEDVWHEVHLRSAQKLLDLCRANRGIYVKLGQHVAQLDYLLPPEYVRTMEATLREAPMSSEEDVRAMFRSEFGVEVDQVFADFSPTPIASASLAQVHRARLRDGTEVAVKIQHVDLREACSVDVRTIEFLVRAVHRAFPRFNYLWLVEEMKLNLPRELNFRIEGQNMERCARIFRDDPDIATPTVLWALSSPCVLTMTFEEGCHIDEREKIEEMGVKPAEVSRKLSEAFTRMIFRDGFVHCDPHAGNVLVRPREERTWWGGRRKRAQIVLLDHGLYRELGDDLRLEYARLWRGLVTADARQIRDSSQALGAGEMYRLFAAILTTKTWDRVTDGSLDSLYDDPSNQAAAAKSKAESAHYAKVYATEISDILASVPRPVLLLLKTNDCLRAVDARLGSPINTIDVTARECARVLAEERVRKDPSWRAHIAAALSVWRVEFSLAVFAAAVSAHQAAVGFLASLGLSPPTAKEQEEAEAAVLLEREELDRIEAEQRAAGML